MTDRKEHTPVRPESGEWFDILNDGGTVIGQASREECHRGTFLLHPVVHVLVFRTNGRLLLQKRSRHKDILPGKWDTSVGGHVSAGESVGHALVREAEEELGIRDVSFEPLYRFIMVTEIERELVHTFRCTWDKPVRFPPEEIEEVREFSPEEIDVLLGTCFFTPNFEEDWRRYLAFRRETPTP